MYRAIPANPEERTYIEREDGTTLCYVEGFGNHHEDYIMAKYLVKELNDENMTEFEVTESVKSRVR